MTERISKHPEKEIEPHKGSAKREILLACRDLTNDKDRAMAMTVFVDRIAKKYGLSEEELKRIEDKAMHEYYWSEAFIPGVSIDPADIPEGWHDVGEIADSDLEHLERFWIDNPDVTLATTQSVRSRDNFNIYVDDSSVGKVDNFLKVLLLEEEL